jgi:hypothetical protein
MVSSVIKIETLLGVRTMGGVNIVSTRQMTFGPRPSVELRDLASIKSTDLGDRHPVDVLPLPVLSEGTIIVNDDGHLYRVLYREGGHTV